MANEVPISAIKKRGFLRQMGERAKNSASTLRDTLLAAHGGKFTANFEGGRLLVSTSGSGQSGSFEIGVQGKEWTQDNVFGLIEQLIETLDAVLAQGLAVNSDAPADIDTLIAVMFASGNLYGVRERGLDVTLIGIPQWGTGSYGA